jgi:hypothetical protein
VVENCIRNDLAKRAIACKHWRWMPGMLTVTGYRLVRPQHGMWRITQHAPENHLDCVDPARHNFVPDLTDPATVGCLLALVREAWGAEREVCEWSHVHDQWSFLGETGDTEAEALVAALEAAP